MREANLRFVPPLCNFEDNVGVLPLALVFYEVEVVVHNAPTYPLAWNKFGDLDGAAVHVSVAVLEFAESVGPALMDSRPRQP